MKLIQIKDEALHSQTKRVTTIIKTKDESLHSQIKRVTTLDTRKN